ncbi:conserved protein of unknown function [Limnospira indica PCC 8005]|uniref:Uncharacterized protein n=1 Tax=Limnospira indica PCC 8005 TaxID=376219 RepID=A0A9P1P149_9CYAN|nr:conserved protein of unknown function [Limnospira indica PCC 8005]
MRNARWEYPLSKIERGKPWLNRLSNLNGNRDLKAQAMGSERVGQPKMQLVEFTLPSKQVVIMYLMHVRDVRV